jgi:hypothetical protein
MSIASKIKAAHEVGDDLDRLLGNKALFDLQAPKTFGGPSSPTLYRALRAGLFPVVKNGNRTRITRETMKMILREGLGRIPSKDA